MIIKKSFTRSFHKITRFCKLNLASNTLDLIFSLIIISSILFGLNKIFNWFLNIADWKVVTQNISLYIHGSYPSDSSWRPLLWIVIIILTSLFTLFSNRIKHINKILKITWIAILPLGLLLLAGGFGLGKINSNSWGGLTLTLILTSFSCIISLPLGILLALAKKSDLPILSRISKLYIDFMRSFPLITVLFFGQLLIPLFLPVNIGINRVIRAILAFSLFTSAYVAEDVIGGIQSIPSTQKEAAVVLGLSEIQTIKLIIIPQALRVAIPSLTNQAVGLFQNTSLMAILGLVELLGIGRSLLANPEFIGRYLEVYIWLAMLYWIFCTGIAMLSRHLENIIKPINN